MRKFTVPKNRRPNAPGEIIEEEYRKVSGLTQQQLADALGISRVRYTEIANGRRRITPNTALRLARVLRTSPEFWLNMQQANDLYDVRHSDEAKEIVKLRPLVRRSA